MEKVLAERKNDATDRRQARFSGERPTPRPRSAPPSYRGGPAMEASAPVNSTWKSEGIQQGSVAKFLITGAWTTTSPDDRRPGTRPSTCVARAQHRNAIFARKGNFRSQFCVGMAGCPDEAIWRETRTVLFRYSIRKQGSFSARNGFANNSGSRWLSGLSANELILKKQ
jgi:hypothetical protein